MLWSPSLGTQIRKVRVELDAIGALLDVQSLKTGGEGGGKEFQISSRKRDIHQSRSKEYTNENKLNYFSTRPFLALLCFKIIVSNMKLKTSV